MWRQTPATGAMCISGSCEKQRGESLSFAHRENGTVSFLDKLPADFFGSDVFVGYQGTYVWQANQLGHIAIGLILASVVSWIFGEWQLGDCLFYGVCAAGVVLYAGKEFLDLLIAKKQAEGLFTLSKRELWRDMAADTWFVASGVGMAAAAHAVHWWGLVAFGVALLAFLALRAIFVPAKKSLDRTGLPYMFRLCNFPKASHIKLHNASRIRAFITREKTNGHEPSDAILIQGCRGTGKTTLAVGMGTEVALYKRRGGYGRCRYVTAFSLFEHGARKAVGEASPVKRRTRRMLGTDDPWSLKCAEVLIIDDVDSDNGVYGGVTPAEILKKLKAQKELWKLLRCKKTVWVTGTGEFENEKADHSWRAWQKALSEFYDFEIDNTKTSCAAADIFARESIPVIWLQKSLV